MREFLQEKKKTKANASGCDGQEGVLCILKLYIRGLAILCGLKDIYALQTTAGHYPMPKIFTQQLFVYFYCVYQKIIIDQTFNIYLY